jgi:antitoxin (DNA-binding transcriptional repressor) of toxin-antitoxin stability system
MSKLGETAVNWKIAEAKQKISEVVRAAEDEPQWIYHRDRLVTAVVPPDSLQEFLDWKAQTKRPTMAEALEQVRRICAEENYALQIPPRSNRPNPFADALDDSPARHQRSQ